MCEDRWLKGVRALMLAMSAHPLQRAMQRYNVCSVDSWSLKQGRRSRAAAIKKAAAVMHRLAALRLLPLGSGECMLWVWANVCLNKFHSLASTSLSC